MLGYSFRQVSEGDTLLLELESTVCIGLSSCCERLCSPITVRLSAQMYTPLHAAAASGQISVVKLLLELGVEVDAVNIYGNTALHVACLNGQDIVVSKLLEFHAAVNAVNHKGMVRPGLWNVVVSLSLDLAFLFIVDFIVS